MAATSGRADAQRNRRRLLDAARAEFGGSGENVTLEAIARAAGVGIGTLYRHFPTREALVEAVYRDERTRLCDKAIELLADHPPEIALRRWMDRFGDYIAIKHEMAETLRAMIASGAVTATAARAELSGAVGAILEAGVAAGTLRDDVLAEDVVVALLGIFLVCREPEQREQAQRMADLLMRGLRAE
ncbi:TetR/AcrR family transcriptional regulator [Nocardia sp. NPDC003482]